MKQIACVVGLASVLVCFAPATGRAQCLGDFNGDGKVTVPELVTAVNNALNGCPVGSQRFVDNGDGTVTDRESLLMWEKKVGLDNSVNFANLHDADNYYVWSGQCSMNGGKLCQPTALAATLCARNSEGGTVGCDECAIADGPCSQQDTAWSWVAALNSANFAGYSDWRIPKRTELQGIVDYADGTKPTVSGAFDGTSCGATCANIVDPLCSCTKPEADSQAPSIGGYWSASKVAYNPNNLAWVIFFLDGTVAYDFTSDYDYVRAVRNVP